MTLKVRILAGVGAILALAVASLAIALSYNAACPPPATSAEGTQPLMKAVRQRCYGSVEAFALEDVAVPVPKDNQILVRVHAAAFNALDYHRMTGKPRLMRLTTGMGAPEDPGAGVDFAGTVEAVGKDVTRFKPGDEVFGGRSGAFAEYVVVREHGSVAHKPPNLTFAQAAAIPVAAVTALQGLRDHGHVQPGQKVLINGASGGVGTFAVQIAKSLGAEVTGVCSGRNVELVRVLGADHVIDYTRQNFTEDKERYDVILDNVGNHRLLALRRVLKPGGIVVMVAGPQADDEPWLSPMVRVGRAVILSKFIDEQFVFPLAQLNEKELGLLADLARDGKMTAVVDRRYAPEEFRTALEYLGGRHARGKVIVDFVPDESVADERPLEERVRAGAQAVVHAPRVE